MTITTAQAFLQSVTEFAGRAVNKEIKFTDAKLFAGRGAEALRLKGNEYKCAQSMLDDASRSRSWSDFNYFIDAALKALREVVKQQGDTAPAKPSPEVLLAAVEERIEAEGYELREGYSLEVRDDFVTGGTQSLYVYLRNMRISDMPAKGAADNFYQLREMNIIKTKEVTGEDDYSDIFFKHEDKPVVAREKATISNIKGFVAYEGASALNGEPIVGIVTYETSNEKTGNMPQLWILPASFEPQEAVKLGFDAAVCGDCPHRHFTGGACYVLPFQAPLSIYRAWKRGAYTTDTMLGHVLLGGRNIRLGAYGDPAALPFEVVSELVASAKGHTGYTHQINHEGFDERFLSLLQVSADSKADAVAAWKRGAKTFRVTHDVTVRAKDERVCLAETHGMTCDECKLCNGGKINIVMQVHGQKANKFIEHGRII